MADDIHRLGGASVGNLRLKPGELRLNPPGISVLLADTPEEAALQMRTVFANTTAILDASQRVASASAEAIRKAGFEVIHKPSKRLPNHYRLVHPNGAAGFTDENLLRLSQVFTETEVE